MSWRDHFPWLKDPRLRPTPGTATVGLVVRPKPGPTVPPPAPPRPKYIRPAPPPPPPAPRPPVVPLETLIRPYGRVHDSAYSHPDDRPQRAAFQFRTGLIVEFSRPDPESPWSMVRPPYRPVSTYQKPRNRPWAY